MRVTYIEQIKLYMHDITYERFKKATHTQPCHAPPLKSHVLPLLALNLRRCWGLATSRWGLATSIAAAARLLHGRQRRRRRLLRGIRLLLLHGSVMSGGGRRRNAA